MPIISMGTHTVTVSFPGEADSTHTVTVVRQWRSSPLLHAYCPGIGTGEQHDTALDAIRSLFGTRGYRVLTVDGIDVRPVRT